MKKIRPWYKTWWIWIVIGIFAILSIGPFIINLTNSCTQKNTTLWNEKDLLSYYGDALSFIGTVILGALALWQNKKLSDENDKYREYLESKDLPVFEIKTNGHNGKLQNLSITIKNLTQNIAHNFVFGELVIKNENEDILMSCEKHDENQNYLTANGTFSVIYRTLQIDGDKLKNAIIEFSFTYNDIFGNEHMCYMQRKITDEKDIFGIFTLVNEKNRL